MHCDRDPVVSVRPGKSAVLYQDPPEISALLQWRDYRTGSSKQQFKIRRADGAVGKFQFKLEVAEPTNADYFNHRQGLRSVPEGYRSSQHSSCASRHRDAAS